ncbi:MAG: S9 family peptidase [Gammaproteobacteria bacterium]|nr:S9 family peptidase [Gammaproteobacteria bacterium]
MSAISPPPRADRKSHSFSHHGVTISDPYAWLKDPSYPEVKDAEILAYLKDENDYYKQHMAPLQGQIDTLFAEFKAAQPTQDASVPYEKNGYWYQWRYAEDAQYRAWFRAPSDCATAWQLLLDEAELAQGKEYFKLGALSVSPDGTMLAYSSDTDGSERYSLNIIDLATRKAIGEPIRNTLDSPVWSARSDALLYTLVSEEWRPYQVWHHQIGNSQDSLIYQEQDSSFFVSIELSQSEQFIFLSAGGHTHNEVFFLPRAELASDLTLINPRRADHEYHVDHQDDHFIIRSNLNHPNFDIFRTPVGAPSQTHWHLIVPGSKSCYLTGHLALSNYLIVEERIDGLDQIRVINQAGKEHYIEWPELSYQVGLAVNPNYDCEVLRLHYTSMVTPSTQYAYDIASQQLNSLKVQAIPSGYEPTEFTTTRIEAPSQDGHHIPISLVHHIDTPIDGSAPLYLYGYGAYGIAIAPTFSASRLSLLRRGFIFAIAHIRGGDDLGYQWYLDGKLDKRTNTFTDFVDCAHYLIHKKYTSAGRLAIAGGSAGGELMGAVVNLAPQLWGAVAAHVPFVDVLNTMLDDQLPLTPLEWPEWGNPIEDANAFQLIQSYSPYDQLVEQSYPPMMVTAGLNDPRVTYWEPAKYVAKLRHVKQDTNVLLLKTNMGAGHGGQSGRFDSLVELAEEYAFFIDIL